MRRQVEELHRIANHSLSAPPAYLGLCRPGDEGGLLGACELFTTVLSIGGLPALGT